MKSSIIYSLLFAFALIFSSGCERKAAIDPISPIINFYLAWKDGEAAAYYNCDEQSAYNAVKRALVDLKYNVASDEATSYGHYIAAGNSNKFKIKITRVETNITKISIRINFMGDKPYAELIYSKIEPQLNVIVFKQ